MEILSVGAELSIRMDRQTDRHDEVNPLTFSRLMTYIYIYIVPQR